MAVFGWIADTSEPPSQWDLREAGWHLCQGERETRADCRHVLICDVRKLSVAQRIAMAEADRPAWRLILLGVEEPAERANLLSLGCAEVITQDTSLRELEARAKRVDDMFGMLPRWRNVGPLTLDLFHRDARRGSSWLNLHPREFGVLWRLSDNPGARVTRKQLLKDVWRLNHEPDTNSVEVHISRLRSKIALAGADEIIRTVEGGGYQLAEDIAMRYSPPKNEADALDHFLAGLGWSSKQSEHGDQPMSCRKWLKTGP